MYTNILRADVKRSGLDPSEWIPATGQGRGTNETQEVLSEFEGKLLYCGSDWTLSTHCSVRLRSLHPWKYSNPTWTQSCATCSEWTCFSRELDQMISRGSFPPKWFCDPVNNIGISQSFSLWSGMSFCLQFLPAVSGSAHLAGTCSSSILKDSWVCFTGGLAWPSKENLWHPDLVKDVVWMMSSPRKS